MTLADRQPTAQGHVAAPAVEVSSWQRRYSRNLVPLDLAGIVIAVGLAQWLRFGGFRGAGQSFRAWTYLEVSVVIAAAWMLALSLNRSRSPRVIGSGVEEYRRVWVGSLTNFGVVAIVSMLFKLEIARGYLITALPVGIVTLLMSRWLARQMLFRQRRRGRYLTRLLVIGSVEAVREFAASIAREPWSGYQVVGACIPGRVTGDELDVPGLGKFSLFGDESTVVGAVIATGSHAVAVTAQDGPHGRAIRDISWELEKVDVELLVAPGVVDVAGPRLHMRPMAGLPLIYVEKPQYEGAKRFQKRLFDIAFSVAVLLFGLPFLLFIALSVKLSSKGPVLFYQRRIGIDGQSFRMYKFRTMVNGADTMLEDLKALNESDGGVLFKIREDPRVTSVGRFLRRYSLDELPQFFNVLRKDMSVVGPRPPLPAEVHSYDDYAKRRLLVRPGITGLWQVSGRSDLSWEDSVRLDLFYVENWSMVTDLLIAMKTFKAMFGRRGAY